MNELFAFCFGGEYEADEVRTTLLKMRRDHLVDLEDAVVAVRDQEGKIKVRVLHHFSVRSAVGGGILGLIVGSIFLTPIFKLVVQEGGTFVPEGVLGKKLGISKNFINEVKAILKPGTSALFVLVLNADPEKVLKDLQQFKGKLLRTTLSNDKAAIKAVLGAAQ